MKTTARRTRASKKMQRARLSRALRRQWLTGTLLQRRGFWTVAQIADALGVSKATCQRDLDLLAELFEVRVAKDPHHRQRSRYRMIGSFKPTLAWLRFAPLLKRRSKTKAAKKRLA